MKEPNPTKTVYRGDIFYIYPHGATSTGSEMDAGRPAIVVSNEAANAHSPVLEVVYLTASPKKDLPTHCTIRSANKVSTALCEQIHSVSWERFGSFIAQCTEEEMSRVDMCLLISLGLTIPEPKPSVEEKVVELPKIDPMQEQANLCYEECIALRAKNELLESQYNSLLHKVISGEFQR